MNKKKMVEKKEWIMKLKEVMKACKEVGIYDNDNLYDLSYEDLCRYAKVLKDTYH